MCIISMAMVLAAEAMNAKLLLGLANNKAKTAKRARKTARAALEIEPNNTEAQLQYAIAYGFYGRHVSPFAAWRKKLPQKILAEIERAALMHPSDSRVEALQGAWHLNLLYKGGKWNVEKRYGANKAKGIAHFQAALKQSKNDIIITANFLMLRFALDPDRLATQTQKELTRLVAQQPRNATERQLLTQMQHVLKGFEVSNAQALTRAQAFLEQ